MADTSQAEQPPQTNGFADDGLDEEERGKIRPADIDADVREMERRKRVEMIMNSRLFREELERIFDTQMKEGGAGPGGLLQQLSDMMGHGGPKGNVFRSSSCVIPINDIRGLESMGYSKGEKVLRCKLAAVYRLMDLYGWTQGIHNHITARLNQEEEHFLVNPWGMLYHEITASSLVKVDMQGNIVEKGTTNYGVNKDSFQLHSAIHAARPDIKCIIHIHTNSVLAVSSLKCGLLPLCQESCVIGEVSSHQYQGGLFEPEERDKISRNLGPNNKVMFLTNHGAMCCGETVEEAFFNVYNTVQACESQIKLLPMGVDNLVTLTDETRKRVYDAARRPPDGFALDKTDKEKDKEVTSPTIAAKGKRWGVGCTEFEALMRMLDNAGFRTGYIYRHPLIKGDPPRPRNDVEVPPAVSSLGYLLEEEEMYRQGGWKKWMEGRKTHDRTRWLNSPNVYQKVEILETGTPDPKKITKWVDVCGDEWVADGSPTHSSTPVKIDTLQFVPKNTNPKEFKRLQQQIKENRRADKITSGPQSHILEGVSWEEAKKLQDANISQTGDQVILVGAASKGIIQRGYQHNAMVYKTPYAKNPFDTVTDDELEEYKKTVTRKARGEGYDEDQSESEALSSSAAGRPPTGKSPTSPISDDESRDECRVLRIESKQAPRPIHAEVVLSDDCSSKKVQQTGDRVRCPLVKSQLIPPRPPHFHHAAYSNLPCTQSAKTVSFSSPCSITRYSQVHRSNQAISDLISLQTVPKKLNITQTIFKEVINDDDDDGDGEGDSLADVSSLPSSDTGCLDENHNVQVEEAYLKSVKVELKDISDVHITPISTISYANVVSEELDCTDYDLERHIPLETSDTTVIPSNSTSEHSMKNATGLVDTNDEDKIIQLEPCVNGKLYIDVGVPCNLRMCCSKSEIFNRVLEEKSDSFDETEEVCCNFDNKIFVDDSNQTSISSQPRNGTSGSLNEDNDVVSTYHEVCEVLDNTPQNCDVDKCDAESMCSYPQLESLNGSAKTTICIGENEKIDMYSIVKLNHGDTSISNSVLVEDVIATRSEFMDQYCESELLVKKHENGTCATIPELHCTYDVSNGNLEIQNMLHTLDVVEDYSESEEESVQSENLLNFHDVSRSNFEVAELIGMEINNNLDFENENQLTPDGAGEILYDLSETYSEEFCSPLSTFAYGTFPTDSGEEYYSQQRLGSTEDLDPNDDLLSAIGDEGDIEIDCGLFSPITSTHTQENSDQCQEVKTKSPSSAVSIGSLEIASDDVEERWPSFVSCDTEPFGMPLHGQELDVQTDSESDDTTVHVDNFDSISRCALMRKTSFSKFSVSTSDIECAGRIQSSPLELGRLFTLKKFKSSSNLN